MCVCVCVCVYVYAGQMHGLIEEINDAKCSRCSKEDNELIGLSAHIDKDTSCPALS